MVIGFLSPNRLELCLGLTTEEEDDRSFLRPLVRSLDRSRILVRVPLGFSGGRLAAREEGALLLARLELEALVTSVRFVLLVDLPVARRSNTLDPVPEERLDVSADSRGKLVLDRRSIKEFFRVTGFFRSLRLCPGLRFPSFSSASSTEMIGTLVTYFPSTSWES